VSKKRNDRKFQRRQEAQLRQITYEESGYRELYSDLIHRSGRKEREADQQLLLGTVERS
jgi:hypothetical protein